MDDDVAEIGDTVDAADGIVADSDAAVIVVVSSQMNSTTASQKNLRYHQRETDVQPPNLKLRKSLDQERWTKLTRTDAEAVIAAAVVAAAAAVVRAVGIEEVVVGVADEYRGSHSWRHKPPRATRETLQ